MFNIRIIRTIAPLKIGTLSSQLKMESIDQVMIDCLIIKLLLCYQDPLMQSILVIGSKRNIRKSEQLEASLCS